MVVLYNLALAIALVASAPWWLLRMTRAGKYRAGLRERLGGVPARIAASRKRGGIWIHAVSVGEVLAIAKLAEELRREYPNLPLLISTTTAAGQKLACERYGEENIFYFPLDFGFAIKPYLRALQPQLVILAETEFWPNFLRLAKQSGAHIAVVNARISDGSLPGYRRWRFWLRQVLTNIDLFLAQSEEDRRRLVAIGAAAERVAVSGNLKFDAKPPQKTPLSEELRQRLQTAAAFPVLVCGSTVEGEELVLLGSFQALLREYPNALMILAPRHPERFDALAALIESFDGGHSSGMPRLNSWRRSRLPADAVLRGGVLLLDSIGELASLYSLATIAFVGGSLVPRGGHNILEPAHFGVPILVGPHTENFRDIVSIFQQAQALRVVRGFGEKDNQGGLGQVLCDLLADSAQREALGRRAQAVVRDQQGATQRTMAALGALLANQPAPDMAGATRGQL
jgi:3-deoxy-D-manno-octulosonic-acid transferase